MFSLGLNKKERSPFRESTSQVCSVVALHMASRPRVASPGVPRHTEIRNTVSFVLELFHEISHEPESFFLPRPLCLEIAATRASLQY